MRAASPVASAESHSYVVTKGVSGPPSSTEGAPPPSPPPARARSIAPSLESAASADSAATLP